MKIVCDSCGAKYSIADEKVQGKVFKIRCKKCSNVIVVKGTDDAAAGDYGGAAAEWYVVIDGDQVGPVPSVEIDSYYMAGKIDADSFVWRDGLSDWVAISTLPDFAHLTQQDVAGPDDATQIAESPTFGDDVDETAVSSLGGAAAAAAGAGAGAGFGAAGANDETISAGVSDDFGSGADAFGGEAYGQSADAFGSGGDLGGGGLGDDFGSGAGSDDYGYAAGGMEDSGYDSDDGYSGFSADSYGGDEMDNSDAGGADDGGGMFAAFDSGDDGDDGGGDFMSFGSGDAGSGGASAGGGGGGAGGGGGIMSQNDMVGQRNENSVLFSLSSLDQVSAVSGDSGGGGGAGPMQGPAAGGGGGEVTEGSGLIDIRALASAHDAMKGSGQDADDGLDPFAHGTMSMPALMPMGSHRSNKPLIIGAVIGGILFLGLVGVVVALTLGGDDKEKGGEQVIVKEIIREVAVPGTDSDSKAEEKAEEDQAKQAAKLAEEQAESGEAESETEEKVEEKKEAKKSNESSKSNKAPASSAKPKTKPKRKDGIDGLLDSIDEKKKNSGGGDEPKSANSGLKSKLSKSDVLGTIKRYQGRVHTCYTSHNSKKLSGTMKVKFYIKPNGRVTNTSVVSSKFKGADVGGCVERVVRGMKFPATSASKNVPVTYPFIMK